MKARKRERGRARVIEWESKQERGGREGKGEGQGMEGMGGEGRRRERKHKCTHATVSSWSQQITCRSQFSPSTKWVPELRLRLPGLAAIAFTY